jgi:hypothetical protein
MQVSDRLSRVTVCIFMLRNLETGGLVGDVDKARSVFSCELSCIWQIMAHWSLRMCEYCMHVQLGICALCTS